MFSKLIIKRFCHQHFPKSKCYENINRLQYLKEDVNEIKELQRIQEQDLKLIKFSCGLSSFLLIVLSVVKI